MQDDLSNITKVLQKAEAVKGKPLSEREIKNLTAKVKVLQSKTLELEAAMIEHRMHTTENQQLQIQSPDDTNERRDSVQPGKSSMPQPEEYGLSDSRIIYVKQLISKATIINKYLSWILYLLALIGGMAIWMQYGGLLGFVTISWLLFMGLSASDSKRLIILWNYKERALVNGFYLYDSHYWKHRRQVEKTERDYWNSLSGSEFEHEVAGLFRRCGYDVEVTPASGDQGIDLVMRSDKQIFVVQCKQWRKPAGPAVIRELYGAFKSVRANEAILICTSGFTTGVYAFAKGKPIRLMDVDDLVELQMEEI